MGLEVREGPDRAEMGLVRRGESSCLQVASEALTRKEAAALSFQEGARFRKLSPSWHQRWGSGQGLQVVAGNRAL